MYETREGRNKRYYACARNIEVVVIFKNIDGNLKYLGTVAKTMHLRSCNRKGSREAVNLISPGSVRC